VVVVSGPGAARLGQRATRRAHAARGRKRSPPAPAAIASFSSSRARRLRGYRARVEPASR
jgi:hypothetical protein